MRSWPFTLSASGPSTSDGNVGLVLPKQRHLVAVLLDRLGEGARFDQVAAEVDVVVDRERAGERAVGRD
jgi:hypothetical protein